MPNKVKRAEFIVEAESEWGFNRGLNLALAEIGKGSSVGESSIPRHDVTVKWNVTEFYRAEEFPTILEPPPALPTLPNISDLDIEDAKGIVGTAGSLEELDILEQTETSGTRTPGGRKGVLQYIDSMRKDLKKKSEKSEKKGEKGAKAKKGAEGGVLSALVEGAK